MRMQVSIEVGVRLCRSLAGNLLYIRPEIPSPLELALPLKCLLRLGLLTNLRIQLLNVRLRWWRCLRVIWTFPPSTHSAWPPQRPQWATRVGINTISAIVLPLGEVDDERAA